MHKIKVYNQNHVYMGFGWIYYRADGAMSVPELFRDDGTEIESGQYILEHTDENHLVVIPRNRQH